MNKCLQKFGRKDRAAWFWQPMSEIMLKQEATIGVKK